MGTEAYKNAANVALSQRELEAKALFKMASNLNEIRQNWEEKQHDLAGALEMNRKLWTIFASELANPDNPMPKDLKEKIGSLALFIFKHSLNTMINPKPEALDVLININTQLGSSLAVKVADPNPASQTENPSAPPTVNLKDTLV